MMGRAIKIRQLDKQDCAAACLASISNYYGLRIPITTIRHKCGTNIEGTNIKGILEAAGSFNLEGHAYKSSPCYTLKNLSGIPTPSILHFKNSQGWLHFVVLYKITSTHLHIMDPSDGEIHKITENEFRNLWTGYLITLRPTPGFTRGDRTTPVWRRLYRLLSLHKDEIIPSIAGSAIYVILGLSLPLYLQFVIDKAIPQKDTAALTSSTLIVATIILLSLFIGYIRSELIIRGGIKMDGTLIMEYIKQIFHLPIPFHRGRSTGEIHSRIGDIYKIRAFISGKMAMHFIAAIALVISFAILFSFYWKLALLSLSFIPVYAFLYCLAYRKSKRDNREIIEAAAAFDSSAIEAISAIDTIKNYSAERFFYRKIEEKYTLLGQNLYKGGRHNAQFSTLTDTVTHLLTFALIILGASSVFAAELTTGELVSFYSISGFFTSPVTILIEGTNDLNEARIASQRVFEILDMDGENTEEKCIPIPKDLEPEIHFKGISYKYPGKRMLFNNLTFSAEKGKITTITGKNGSGKSTLAALLMRNYTPENGHINVGNLNINLFHINEWRKYISIIPQQESLFDGNVLENIVVGEEMPDISKVMKICELVGMIDFIDSLPRGMLTQVGEKGKFLSGGERVKISVARALYRDPKVLVMDEITSHLDELSADRIYSLCRKLAESGITIINITHDRKFLEYSDYIVNLDKCDHTQVNSRTPLCCGDLT